MRIAPRPGPGGLHGEIDAVGDVVGVDEQRRRRALVGHLGAERVELLPRGAG